MDSRRKATGQMLGTLLADAVMVTAKMHSPEEQAMIDAIKSAQGISQSRPKSACAGAPTPTTEQRRIEAAIRKREDEAIDSLVRTLAGVIRDKHRGFKVSINVTRGST